jgi:hypothetical protein
VDLVLREQIGEARHPRARQRSAQHDRVEVGVGFGAQVMQVGIRAAFLGEVVLRIQVAIFTTW